jgi:hypothetical protein
MMKKLIEEQTKTFLQVFFHITMSLLVHRRQEIKFLHVLDSDSGLLTAITSNGPSR